MAAKNFDEYLSQFGNPGRCQLLSSLIILFIFMQWGMVQQFSILMSYVPDHRCKILGLDNKNLSTHEFVPKDQCSMYSNAPPSQNSNIIPCNDGYEYLTLKGEIYPSNEFDLVCDREYLFRLSLTVPAIGVMLGGLVFGTLSDKYGRKGSMRILAPFFSAMVIGQVFAPDLTTFIILRFLLGFVAQGIQTNCITYTAELFRRKIRTYMNLLFSFVTACTLTIQMYGMYFLINWRYEQFIVGLITLPTVVIIWFLPESVSWLLSKGRIEESRKILQKFAKCNNLLVSPMIYDELEVYSNQIRHNSATKSESAFTQGKKLFTNSTLRRFILSIMYTAFTTSCVLNALSFSIALLDGNLYTNYLINGGVQIGTIAVAVVTFTKFGRVKVLFTHFVISGILGAAAYILLYYDGGTDAHQFFITGMALLARNLIQSSTAMLMTFSSELLPTSLRSTGVGIAYMSGRLGSVVAPQILYTLNHFWQPLPQTIFGALCIIAAIVVIFLPETFHRPMPNSIEDVENFMRKDTEPMEKTPLIAT